MKLSRVTLPNDPVTLAGLAYRPDAAVYDLCLVLAHGYTASKESMDLLAAYLCKRGHECFTFDFRGHKLGGSTGALNHAKETVRDLDAAARGAMRHFGRPRCVLVGHSMGALVGFVVAAQRAEVAGLAAITTGMQPSRSFLGPVGIAMLAQRGDYVEGLESKALLAQMDAFARYADAVGERPVLCVAARGDVLVKPGKVRELAARVGPHAEFVEVDGNHLEAPGRARGVVANWLDRVCAPFALAARASG